MANRYNTQEERNAELEEHKKVREEVFMDYLENKSNLFKENIGNHKNNTPQKKIQGSGFFAQDNVKEFQREMVSHSFEKMLLKKRVGVRFLKRQKNYKNGLRTILIYAVEQKFYLLFLV